MSAAFCWRCYGAFQPVGSPSAGPVQPSAWPAQPSSWPPAPAPTYPSTGAGPRFKPFGAVVAVAIGVIVAVSVVTHRQSAASFPDSLPGLERVSTAQTDAAAESLRAASEAHGLDADMAFYGSGSMPQAALMWVRGADETLAGPDEVFDTFAAGFTSGSSGTLVTSDRSERRVDGVTYVCAPVTGSLGAGLCMWQEDDLFWVLLDVRPGSGIDQTQDLAVAVRDAAA